MTPGSHNILVSSDWGSQNILVYNDWGSHFIGESKFTATPVPVGFRWGPVGLLWGTLEVLGRFLLGSSEFHLISIFPFPCTCRTFVAVGIPQV